MSRELESVNVRRYSQAKVIDHLASNYVLGLLNQRVKNRVDALRADFDHRALDQRISYWEQKMSPLNSTAEELTPLPETWQNIQAQLNIGQVKAPKKTVASGILSFFSAGGSNIWKYSSAFSLVICAVLGFALMQPSDSMGPLSYVAVLEDDNKTPQVVAATYGDSKKLVLDILTLPQIDSEQTYELWVTSKTDNQTRSLGEIPRDQSSFDRQLSVAEWRLIADSSFLIISVEDEGGSAIGEPSEMIISKGLCIRLAGGEVNT